MSIAAAESKNRISIFQSFMSVNAEPSRTTAILEYDGDACTKEKYNWGKCVIQNNIRNTCNTLEREYAKCISSNKDNKCDSERKNWITCILDHHHAIKCESSEIEYAKCIIKSIDIAKNQHQQVCESTK